MKSIAEGIGELTLVSKDVNTEDLDPGVNCWVIDSGSGRHLVAREVLDENTEKHIIKVDEPLRLRTAGGIVTTNCKVKMWVEALGMWLMAWVLPKTPLVLGLHDLVENHGFDFTFRNVKGKAMAFLSKGSKKKELPVKSGFPVLKA